MKNRYPYYLIIGLGKSGISMAKFLNSKGYNVVATDIDHSRDKIADELSELGIQTQIGFHDQKTFNHAEIMIPSPGIPLNNKFIKTALDNGVEITGELDIFTKYNKLPIIAITGTNGKTTVTTLIGNILEQSQMNPFVGGNIGTPLIDYLMPGSTLKRKEKTDNNEKIDNKAGTKNLKEANNLCENKNQREINIIVAEISSFQLDISKNFKPDIGVLLNISQDHLDRYEDYADYTNSKWSVFKNQDSSDQAVINCAIDNFDQLSPKLKSNIISFSSKNLQNTGNQRVTQNKQLQSGNAQITSSNITIKFQGNEYKIPTENLKELQGTHNKENIAAAALASLAAGADIQSVLKGIKTFKNLSHRMQFVKAIKNIAFYNDSKATNTDAVIRAIECFKNNIILILGGREKSTDFSELTDHIKKSVKAIIAMGETSLKIKNIFEKICPVKIVKTMKDGVQTAFALALKNDIVLLSPACASFDMYDSYADRGDDFTDCVKALGKG